MIVSSDGILLSADRILVLSLSKRVDILKQIPCVFFFVHIVCLILTIGFVSDYKACFALIFLQSAFFVE